MIARRAAGTVGGLLALIVLFTLGAPMATSGAASPAGRSLVVHTFVHHRVRFDITSIAAAAPTSTTPTSTTPTSASPTGVVPAHGRSRFSGFSILILLVLTFLALLLGRRTRRRRGDGRR